MIRWLAGFCLMLSPSMGALAADAVSVPAVELSASAWLDVDPSGSAHVAEMGPITKLERVPALVPIADQIKQLLRHRIESWRFEPAMKNGVAVPSRTNIYVFMEGRDDGRGGLAVTILSASTGAALEDNRMGALVAAIEKAGTEGQVTMAVEYGSDGHVTDARITDAMGFDHGRFAGPIDRDLRKGALAAARKWVFAPEVVDGQPVGGSGSQSIRFCLFNDCEAAGEAIDVAVGVRQQFVAMDPAVKLRSAVAGTAL